MAKYLHSLLFLCLACCLISTCQLGKNEDEIIISLIDEEFRIALWENLSPQGRTLAYRLETIENQQCLNTTILGDVTRSNNNIDLTIYSILHPETCHTADAPAKIELPVGVLSNGLYRLSLELQNVIDNTGKLTVTDSKYAIVMDSEEGIQWERYELMRVPEGLVWGFLTFENNEQRSAAQAFIQELAEMSQPAQLATGYYGYFASTDNGAVFRVKDQPVSGSSLSFVYQNTGASEALEQLVANYRENASAQQQVFLMDSFGSIY